MNKNSMAGLALAMTLFIAAMPVAAEPIEFDLRVVTLRLPFQDCAAVSLYDIVGRQGLVGAETTVLIRRGIHGTVGAITTLGLEGTPFIGLKAAVPESVFGRRVDVGLFYARDFNANQNRAGLLASVPLWE